MNKDQIISRRDFFKVTAISGGGMLIGISIIDAVGQPVDQNEALSNGRIEFTPSAFIRIAADGMITLIAPTPEIGQGVKTSLPLIIAEELCCDWKIIKVEVAPIDNKRFGLQRAGGSGSVRGRFTSFRKAGATAREMLISAAANTWNVQESECHARNGFVVRTSDGEKLSFGSLASKAAGMPVPADPVLKETKDFTIIGTRIVDLDAGKIVTGKPLYGIDTRRQGMLYALVARPPAFGKALKSFDDSDARKVTGVKNVVQIKNSVAVLGTSTWAAKKGRDALILQWEDSARLESTSEHSTAYREMLHNGTPTRGRNDGDVASAFSGAERVIDVIYEVPALSHAQMEPLNFFAHVHDGKAELFGPTQVFDTLLADVAKALNILPENISIGMPARQGGGFGRKLYNDYVIEACLVSAAAKCPVQVQWTREDDMQNDFYRTSGAFRYKAALTGGSLLAWHQSTVALGQGWPSGTYVAGILPNYLTEAQGLVTNIPTGWWRAPGDNILAFAAESFMDEICSELKKDPVAFRLELFSKAITQPVGQLSYNPGKYKGVVELVASMSNWGKSTPGIFRGMATWYSYGSYAAHVVDIKIVDGKPRVQKVYCAVDCGRVINLSGAENQVQGAIVDGIGHALMTKLTFEKGSVVETNFDRYTFLRIKDAPLDIEVKFVNNEDAPTGLGEPGLPPAAPALANALFAATGKRYRQMPFDL